MELFCLVALSCNRYEAVALPRCLLDCIRAAEEVLLPVVGAILDCELRPWCDGFDGPHIGLICVHVAPNLHIRALREPIIDTAAPAVGGRWIGVDDYWLAPRGGRHRVRVNVRPDVDNILSRGVQARLRAELTPVLQDACASGDSFQGEDPPL